MVVARSDKGLDGRANDLNVMSVSASDYLLVGCKNPPNPHIVLASRDVPIACGQCQYR